MIPEDCSNPGQPCQLHDEDEKFEIVVFNRAIHGGWFIAAFMALIVVSLLPGLN